MRHFRYTPPLNGSVDVVVSDVCLWSDETPTGKLRGVCIGRDELTASVEYDNDGSWSITAISFDADEKLSISHRWDNGRRRATITNGPLFDLLVIALRQRHADEIDAAVSDDMSERRNDADASYYDWLDDQRKEARIAAE